MVRLPQDAGMAIVAGSLAIIIGGCGRRSDSPTPESAESDLAVQGSAAEVAPSSGAPITPESAIGASPSGSSAAAEPEPPRSKSPAQLRAEILSAMEAGDDDLAFELVRAAKRVAPSDPQVTFLMALILSQRNRFREAIMMLDAMARSLPSTRGTVLGQTADWLVESGQWSAAEMRYRELLDQAPQSAIGHRNLAQLLVRQGRRLEAAANYRQLCRQGDVEEIELRSLLTIIHPFGGDAVKQRLEPIGSLGNARFAIGVGNWNAAAEALKLSPSAHPVAASAFLGRVLAQLQDFESLAKWIDEAPAEAQRHSDYWFALGTLQTHRGQHHAALSSFCQTVLRDATDAQAYLAMSRSLREMGAESEAAVAAQRAQLIERTQAIGEEMASSSDRDYDRMTSLIETLEQLSRPFEAFAWRAVRVVYGQAKSALPEADARQRLAKIVAERAERLKSNEPDATRDFLLCGVDLESLGLDADVGDNSDGKN
jgi:tetratricopeptide (TPR) repeat protein